MESLYLFVKTTFFIDKILKNLEKAAQCIAAESANLKRGVDISGKKYFLQILFCLFKLGACQAAHGENYEIGKNSKLCIDA